MSRAVAASGPTAHWPGRISTWRARVRNTITRLGIAPERAAAMAATHPAAFLGLSRDRGVIVPGKRADWVQLDAAFHPTATIVGGDLAATARSEPVPA